MASTSDILSSVLDFSEDQFFAADRSVLGPREARLLDQDFTGIVVNAPRKIATSRRATLPLVLASRSSGERDWEVPVRENCILVGVNLDDGTVRMADPLATEKERTNRGGRETPPRGEKPTGLASEGAQLTALEARKPLRIEWNTAKWALAMLNFDWRSNVVIVDLDGDRMPAVSPVRSASPPPNPACGGPTKALPCYLPVPGTPPAPPSGAAFTLELGDEQKRLEVRGAFAVTLRDRHVAPRGVVHELDGGRREDVAAVVPMTLAVLGLDWHEPLRFDWAVPVYGPVARAGSTARGNFAIDAFAGSTPTPLAPGKYVAYLIVDDNIAGPQTLTVPGR